jgi:hypothetical protein
MNRQLPNQNMKNQIRALLLGVTFGLASASSSHAMSSLISLSTTPLWPVSATPDSNLVYTVTTVARAGSGMLQVALTAGAMPPGVTVTFSPSVLKFTGNQVSSQTAQMIVSCSKLVPLDSFPFTLTGTALRESITITNVVMFSADFLATRVPTLFIDSLTNSAIRLRGLGGTGKTYQIQATPTLSSPVWTQIGISIADGNGRFTYPTNQVPGCPALFYRAVTTPGPVLAQ